jgi:hypothetical protein
MHPGVISNRASRRNRRDGLAMDPLRRRPTLPHAVLDGVAGIPAAVADFARRGVDPIVIDGGDGTVQRVLTAVAAEPGYATLPRFAIVPSGTTNMTARDVGGGGRREAVLESLLAAMDAAGTLRVLRRRTIALSAATGPIGLGFFLGAGALVWATALTRRGIEARGAVGDLAVALGAAATLLRCLCGSRRGQPRAGVRLRLVADGRPRPDGPRFLLLATTLDRLVLGLDPFWGTGDGPIKVLDVAAPPARLAMALPAVLRGRPRPWMGDAGYRSFRAGACELAVDGPVLFDGETVPVAPGTALSLRAGPETTFIAPP